LSLYSEIKRRNVFRVGAAYIVVAWLVIQVVATIAPIVELPNTVQKLILVLLVAGFPVSLVLAWIFEIGPQGIQRDMGSAASGFGRKIDYAIIGILVVALVYSILTRPSVDEHVDRSIAVLPFANMSGNKANDPFTAGIHDDLLTQLSRIKSIRTISRTTMLRYEGSAKSIPEIAQELDVGTVLEGGVQRTGDRLRVNVQLIHAIRDEHLWAQTYDRELSATNVFEIQSEIARSIAGSLRATLTEDDEQRLASIPTKNIEALDRYFIGRQLLEQRTRESLEAAIRYFEQVTELDPDFALGWSGLADSYMLMPEYSSNFDRDLVEMMAKDAIARALDLNPDLPEVHASKAWYELRFYRWDEAERIFREALEVYPDNVNVLHWMSHVQSFQGRFDEALIHARHAVEVEPDSKMMQTNLVYILVDAKKFDEGLKLAYRFRESHPEYTAQTRNLFLHELRAGRPRDAASTFIDYVESIGADTEAAREIGDKFIAWVERGEPGTLNDELIERTQLGSEDLAQVLAALGDAEGAIRALNEAIPEHSGSRSVFSMKINPLYDFFRADPRFKLMLKRVNLAH